MRRLAALVALVFVAAPEAATADWLSLRSDHFQVVGNASERDLRTVALKFEQFRDVISQLNPALLREGSAPPVTVLVFRDKRSYEPFMPRANGRVVPVTGYFQPGQDANYITLTLEAGEQAFPVIFHEYAHLLLRGVFAGAPLWFSEGIAEYYSTLEISTSRRANIGKPVQRHLDLLRERRLPFARFFAVDRNSPEYTRDITERSVLYAQSWAIVHHAFHGESKRKDQLLAFVTKLSDGGSTEGSFREAYGIEVRDLEREVQLYVQKTAHVYMAYTLPDTVVRSLDAKTAPVSDSEADAWLGDLLVHMNRGEEATPRLEKALAAKPDLALAHAALGTLQMREDKTAEGLGHLKEAVTLGTTNEVVYFRYAYGLVSRGARDEEALTQASRALERAVELRPGYSEAKLLLGFVYLAAGNYSGARDVMTALVRAEPTNHRAALQLGEALVRLNDIEGVRAAVGPVLARSTDEAERDRARRLLEVSVALQTRRETLAAAGLPPSSGAPPSGSTPVAGAPAAGRPPAPDPAVRPVFRQVGPGEQHAYGVFEAVECGQDGIVLVVRTATAVLRARASSFSEIDFIAYRSLATMSVNCGPQTPRLEIYLTWRLPPGANAGTAGTAVAVEILPEGFIPAR